MTEVRGWCWGENISIKASINCISPHQLNSDSCPFNLFKVAGGLQPFQRAICTCSLGSEIIQIIAFLDKRSSPADVSFPIMVDVLILLPLYRINKSLEDTFFFISLFIFITMELFKSIPSLLKFHFLNQPTYITNQGNFRRQNIE